MQPGRQSQPERFAVERSQAAGGRLDLAGQHINPTGVQSEPLYFANDELELFAIALA